MAERLDSNTRFEKITTLIANEFVAEVCSIYLLRADHILDLHATHGLRKSAIHTTQLPLGAGLVGCVADTAKPLNLRDAPSHPDFVYRPETGEDPYHSFLGVPILRAGRTLGVLVVQNRIQRSYSEDEVDTLSTTAMVIAEALVAGNLEAMESTGEALPDFAGPVHVRGLAIAEGIGRGAAILHEPRIMLENMVADSTGDRAEDLERLERGIEALRISLDDLLENKALSSAGEHRDVLETYRMFAHDRGWVRRLRESVRSGMSPEGAAYTVLSDIKAQMDRQGDPFFRERLHDLADLSERLLRQLTGADPVIKPEDMPGEAVIVARSMGAAELLEYGNDKVRGLVLQDGGPSSHVAIVARALGIAAVSQCKKLIAQAEPGDLVIVDGESGVVNLRPPADIATSYDEKSRLRQNRQARYNRLIERPAVTADGVRVRLQMNAGLLVDLPSLRATGAEGIGLFRTELHFMLASAMPRIDAQRDFYRKVVEGADPLPVTFRTLDVGGDKLLPYLRMAQGDNPAMGWRAIRLALDRPAVLRTQLRALMRACAGRHLRLMFPMVSDSGEFERARAFVERERLHLTRHGHDLPHKISLGVTIETPALLYQLDTVLDACDFISVGTNDLFQFMFAVDRGNAQVSARFDPLHLAFFRVLMHIRDEAGRRGVPVSVCGDIAGQPGTALLLVAAGFRDLSMMASQIGPVKQILIDNHLAPLADDLKNGLEGEAPWKEFIDSLDSRIIRSEGDQ